MKTKDVLRIMGITRSHLSRLVKQGKIGVTEQPNGRYVYNTFDVYNYVGKKRRTVTNVNELEEKIKQGILVEHPSWEDLIDLKNLETEIQGIP